MEDAEAVFYKELATIKDVKKKLSQLEQET